MTFNRFREYFKSGESNTYKASKRYEQRQLERESQLTALIERRKEMAAGDGKTYTDPRSVLSGGRGMRP